MKIYYQIGLFFALIFFLCPNVCSYSVNCEPRQFGSETGQGVVQNCHVDFTCTNGDTFPASGTLAISTDLTSPQWSGNLIIDEDGIFAANEANTVQLTNPHSYANPWTIGGGMLSYPCGKYKWDEVSFALFGYVPLNPTSSMNFIKIEQRDGSNNVIQSSTYTMPMTGIVHTPTPTPTSGSVSTSSSPSGAKVYIDEVYKGITPLVIDGVTNGGHVVRFKLDGYQDSTQVVSISGNTVTANSNLVVSTTTAQTTSTTAIATTAITQTATTTSITTTSTTVPVTTTSVQTTATTAIQTTPPITIQTASPTAEITTLPITSIYTQTTKATSKPTANKFTPIPTSTPTQESPLGFELILLAIGIVGLCFISKR